MHMIDNREQFVPRLFGSTLSSLPLQSCYRPTCLRSLFSSLPAVSINSDRVTPLAKSRDYKERQVDREKRKVFVTAHVILRTAAMFSAGA